MRDDRVLAATRWTVRLVIPVLVVGGTLLYGFPGDTEGLWAWPVRPELTALAMGGGYLAGAVFFARAATAARWHEMATGFIGASVLSALLLAATVLHWDRFTHGHPAFWIWLGVYAVVPVLLPVLWLVNRRHDPGPSAGDRRLVPQPVRRLVGAAGVVHLAAALTMFVQPSVAGRWWPWAVTPLTVRSLSAFVAFIAVVLVAFLVEARWSALRLHVESASVGLVLVALGALRASGDLEGGAPAMAGFVAVLVALTGGLAWLWVVMRAPVGPDQSTRRPAT